MGCTMDLYGVKSSLYFARHVSIQYKLSLKSMVLSLRK